MAEIVRVLKWRLDLESAGMAEGLEKAATNADKLAAAGAKILATAPPALKATASAAKETDAAFEGLGLEAQVVEKYVRALEKGSGSPLAVERNAQMATAAFATLAQSANKAGQAIPEAFTDRVFGSIDKATTHAAALEAQLNRIGGLPPTKFDNVIKSNEAVGKSMKEAALRSQEMASGMGLLASAGGPAGMALASVASQSGAAGNAMIVAAGKMALLTAAAKLGWETGKKLDDTWKQAGFDLSDGPIDAGLKKLEENLKRTSEAAEDTTPSILGLLTGTANLDKGMANLPQRFKDAALNLAVLRDRTDEAGTSFKGLAADIALDDERLTAHTRALQGQIVARRALLNEVDKTSAAFSAALPGWQSTAEHAQKLKDQIDAVAAKFKSFGSTGADMRKEVEANQVPLAAFVAMLEKEKIALDTLPQPLQDAIKYTKELAAGEDAAAAALANIPSIVSSVVDALVRLKGAHEATSVATAGHGTATRETDAATEEAVAATEQHEQALLDEAAAYEGSAWAADDAANARRDATTADRQAEIANQDFGTSLDYVAKRVVETGGTLTVGVPILLSVTEATREMTDAMLDAAVATGKLRAEQAQALDATKGWTDYVLALKAGYDNGVTSLGSYMQQLIAFKSQITQMFAGATGDAKEAVTALQDLIQSLMGNIGPGQASSGNTLLDELNKSVAAAKGKK